MMIATWPGRRSASRPALARRCSVSASKVEVVGIMQIQISITPYRLGSVGADRDDGNRQTDQLTQPVHVRPGGRGEICQLCGSIQLAARPSGNFFVNGTATLEPKGVRREVVHSLAIQLVRGANRDFLSDAKHVQEHDGQ